MDTKEKICEEKTQTTEKVKETATKEKEIPRKFKIDIEKVKTNEQENPE